MFIGSHLLTVSSHAEGGRELSGVSLKGTNPIDEGFTLRTSSPPQRSYFLIPSHWGLGFLTNEFWRDTNIQSTQYSVMAYMGKESKKEWIYIYITDSLC